MKRWLPAAVVLLAALWIISVQLRPDSPTPFDLKEFGKIPVLVGGRIKPLDTVARTSLMVIHGKQVLRTRDDGRMEAIAWLAELMMRPDLADHREVFLIHDPDLSAWFAGTDDSRKTFSFAEIHPHFEEIQRQAARAAEIDVQLRNRFERAVVRLHSAISLYARLKHSLHDGLFPDMAAEVGAYASVLRPGMQALNRRQAGQDYDEASFEALIRFADRYRTLDQAGYFFPVPHGPPDSTDWRKAGMSLLESLHTGSIDPGMKRIAEIVTAYRFDDPERFNQAVAEHLTAVEDSHPQRASRASAESFFNHLSPFYKSMVLYVGVFLLACASWLVWPRTLAQSALWLATLAFVLHTSGIIFRMWLEGRPPVTNLYSSAVFVGWGSALLGLLLERWYRNGIGACTVAAVGFCTLLVAHHLSGDGDTMEMLRAVLDSNFWLATHVVVITMGYAATFLAGFLGIIFVFRGVFSTTLAPEVATALSRMIYGVLCFALLFSFAGTVLGGIWADQSWGRFWGWDPKENGALLIVLWIAAILHARWGGYIRMRGLANMAIFGNIVTSWSWFGTNMLGIGLHSYGFMEQAFLWLALFMLSQLAIIAIGCLPSRLWRSRLPGA